MTPAGRRDAFAGWGRTTPAERMAALLRRRDEARADDLAAVEHRNAGKPTPPWSASRSEASVDATASSPARRTMETRAGEYPEGYTSMLRREAVGVGLRRSPRGTTHS